MTHPTEVRQWPGHSMIVAVVATASRAAAARETVRTVLSVDPGSRCEVLDMDGRYRPYGPESVSTPQSAGLHVEAIRLTHDDETLLPSLTAIWSAHLLGEEPVLGLVPGVVLLGKPAWREDPRCTIAVARAAVPDPLRHPATSILANELFVLGTDALPHRDALERLAADWRTAHRWLDLFVPRLPHRFVVDDAVLVSRFNSGPDTVLRRKDRQLTRDGEAVVALDLAGVDPDHPWLFDARSRSSTGPLLSRNAALHELVAGVAAREREDAAAPLSDRPDQDLVRGIARAAIAAGRSLDTAYSRPREWMLELLPAGDRTPVARYLAGIRDARQDLMDAFPHVPGRDSVNLARWAIDYGIAEPGYDPALLRDAADLTIAAQPSLEQPDGGRPAGVNLVGYLTGELGVGTSARLMDEALEAAGVPTSTFAASAGLQSRAAATYRRTDGTRYDASLIAVNADQMEAVTGSLGDVVCGTYRIGMWYWEVESFPESRDAAFAFVDEVWAATDFVRDAIAERATVPVRTVTPPLPQRSVGDPPGVPARLNIPLERAWFFFAFDYLSTVQRKNPLGLVEAFTRAFPHGDDHGPVLVIKTLNAGMRMGEAERVRLAVAGRQDVILIEEYLEPEELRALMARCTAYVSLHRSEGLGLTIAEAMAWGRPVVVTAYSGNMQFTNDRNAFLVPCKMTAIPSDADPYPAGTLWADPDLDEAAAILRRIIDDPDSATAVGGRAEEDIRRLHSPEVAAQRVRESLRAGWDRRDEMLAQEASSARRPFLRRVRTRIRRAVFRAGGRRR